jgi:hypothetical protein
MYWYPYSIPQAALLPYIDVVTRGSKQATRQVVLLGPRRRMHDPTNSIPRKPLLSHDAHDGLALDEIGAPNLPDSIHRDQRAETTARRGGTQLRIAARHSIAFSSLRHTAVIEDGNMKAACGLDKALFAARCQRLDELAAERKHHRTDPATAKAG